MTEAERMIPEAYCEPICLAIEWFKKGYGLDEIETERLERITENIVTRKWKPVSVEKNQICILRDCVSYANSNLDDCGLSKEIAEEIWEWIDQLNSQLKKK